MSSDALRAVRSAFYLGQYKNVIKESKNIKDSKENINAADVFYYRSLIAMGSEEQVLKGINNNSPYDLQAVRLLATYYTTSDDNKDMIFDSIKEWNEKEKNDRKQSNDSNSGTKSESGSGSGSGTWQLIASLIYYSSNHFSEALRYIADFHENLEMLAMTVSIYIKINRVDLAQKQVKSMQDIDDDDVLTVIASSTLNIALGGDKASEAFYLQQELIDKFGPSVPVLNSMAACQMQQKKFTEAFALLKQARDMCLQAKEKVSSETLINSIVCLQHLRKSNDIIQKVIGELRQTSPTHPWLKRYADMESIFDKNALSYKIS